MAGDRRLTGLDGLRGLAAAGIVLLHVWMYTGAHDPARSALLDGVIGELRLGVAFFFVVSGFLLAGPWVRAAIERTARPSLTRYAAHRAARLVPAYWVALAAAFAVLSGTGHPREAPASSLWAFGLFVHNQVPTTAGKLDPPVWSLGIETAFYAALPVLGWWLVRSAARAGRRGMLTLCAGLVACGLAWTLSARLASWGPAVTTSLPTYLPLFACGIAARLLVHDRAPARATRVGLLVAGAAAVLANGLWHAHGTGLLGHVVLDLPAAAGFAAIVAALATGPGGVLDTAPMRALGTISYGTYLWHMPVLYWLRLRHLLPDRPALAFLAVLGPTLALATLSWFGVERPVLNRLSRRRRTKARRRAEPVATPA
jgi:peptidoglycan/LPS O-acetylase OafA/YrhL